MQNTVYEVDNDSGSYTECGRTTTLPNTRNVTVTCRTPLIGTRLRLRRYGDPRKTDLELCEVMAIGYIYQGEHKLVWWCYLWWGGSGRNYNGLDAGSSSGGNSGSESGNGDDSHMTD